MKKRILALFLALVIAFGCTASVNAISLNPFQKKFQLVVFGDSATNGYGLRGYASDQIYNWTGTQAEIDEWKAKRFEAETWDPHDRYVFNLTGYRNIVPGSTADQIANLLRKQGKKVELHQLALSGSRIEELRALLYNDDYMGDVYTQVRLDARAQWIESYGGIEGLRKDFQETTKKADLVVIDIGGNNFGTYVAHQLFSNAYTNDMRNILSEDAADFYYASKGKIKQAIAKLVGVEISAETQMIIDSLADTLSYAIVGYCTNFDKVIERIHELNPCVDIVVSSVQNTSAGMALTIGGVKVPFGDLLSIPVNIANAYVSMLSPHTMEYRYADISSKTGCTELYFDTLLKYNGDPKTLDQNMIDCVNVYDDWSFIADNIVGGFDRWGGPKKGSDESNAGLVATYDAIYRLLQASANNDDAELIDFAAIPGAIDEWYKFVINNAVDAGYMAAGHQDYHDFIDAKIEELRANKNLSFAGAMAIRVLFGNGFFSHPTYAGSAERAKAIMDAYNCKNTRCQILAKAFRNQKKLWTGIIKEYGDGFKPILFDLADDVFKYEKLPCYLKVLLPKNFKASSVLSYIFDAYEYSENVFMSKLNAFMSSRETRCCICGVYNSNCKCADVTKTSGEKTLKSLFHF